MRKKPERAHATPSANSTKQRAIFRYISVDSIGGVARWLIGALLVGMPFHAFVVVVLGHTFGAQLVFASWKEVIILLLTLFAGLACLQRGFDWLRRPANYMVGLIAATGIFGIVLSGRYDMAALAGIKTTLLPMILFVAVQPFSDKLSWQRVRSFILVPAGVVAVLALLQFFITPTLLLQSLGYGPSTINPYQTVSVGGDLGRSFATLGGPNQLGAYLILPAIWLCALALTARKRQMRLFAALGSVISVLAMTTSFSRSALLGVAVGLVALLGLWVSRKYQPFLLLGGVVGASVGWLKLQELARVPGSVVQTYFIRGQVNDQGVIIGTDEGHVNAWQQGLDLALRHPFGLGFGSAGPASKYGSGYVITENWYVQLLLELGWIGILAFGVLVIDLARGWWLSDDRVSKVLLASLLAILMANLFLHTFADSTLSIIWWILAGLSYGAARTRGHDGA